MKNKTNRERRIQKNMDRWEQILPDDRRWLYLPMAEDNDTDINLRFSLSEGEPLEEISIPGYIGGYCVRQIGRKCFYYERYLRSVTLPDTVEILDYAAFKQCEKLETIKFPSGLKEIDWEVFAHCTSLKQVELPQGLTRIGNKAFYHCTNLQKVYLPASVTYIGVEAFAECGGATGHMVTRTATRSVRPLSSYSSRREMEYDYGPDAAFALDGASAERAAEIEAEHMRNNTYTYTEYVSGGVGKLIFEVDADSYAHKWCLSKGYSFVLRK